MNRLIRAAFYQTWKQKQFFIFMIASAVLAVGYAVLLNAFVTESNVTLLGMIGMSEENVHALLQGMDGFRYLPACLSFGEYFCIMLAVYITLQISAEYQCGVLKNMLSRGITKKQYYVSRMIVCGLQADLLLAVFLFVSSIMSVILWGVSPIPVKELGMIAMSLVLAFLMVFVIADFLFMIASYISNTAFAMAANICMMLLVSTGIQLLSDIIGGVFPVAKVWIVSVLLELSNASLVPMDIVRVLITAVIYLAIVFGAGYMNLKKKQF